jgi:hypothetical protein
MAMLDAILEPEWLYRYYSFNSRWADGAQMGSMRDGCGNDFFALFNSAGCFLKGFVHEALMADVDGVWPGVLDDVPPYIENGLKEPAFKMDDTTFCIWRRPDDDEWRIGVIEGPDGPDPDGSMELLSPLDGDPKTYRAWAEDYYERKIDPDCVRAIYAHEPLADALVAKLNPDLTFEELIPDIEEIDYPRG